MVFGQNSVQAVNLGICDCLQSSAWAELKERACGAFGSAGDAGLASVVNQAMREINPFGFSDNLHEVAFNDLRILRCCQTEEVCDPGARVCRPRRQMGFRTKFPRPRLPFFDRRQARKPIARCLGGFRHRNDQSVPEPCLEYLWPYFGKSPEVSRSVQCQLGNWRPKLRDRDI